MKYFVCILALGVLGGCVRIERSGGARGLLPEIPALARPVLVELTGEEQVEIKEKLKAPTVSKIRGNFEALHLYARKLEIGIDGYNHYVRLNNALVRKELGLPEEKLPVAAEPLKESKP